MASRNHVENPFEFVIEKLGWAASDIGRDLGVDSLTLMNIVMELEDVFELSIPIDRLADVETVGDLAALINELRARG